MKKTCFLGFSFVLLLSSSVPAQQAPAPPPLPAERSGMAVLSSRLPIPGPVDFEVREQLDSPLRIAVDENMKGRLPGAPLSIRNDGGSHIVAFVLRVDVEPFGMNQMVILGVKGLGIGESKVHGLGLPMGQATGSKPVISVDYVQFADGKSWGEDSLGRGKQVSVYLEGRNLALSRLQQLLAGQDDTEIRRAVEVFSSSGFSEPNLTPTGRTPRPQQDWHARGYEEVINILRRMPRHTEAAKELARKLEIMAASKGN